MPRKKRHEEHVNHEAWAIPYGDLITLLLAFFVVMYAVSAINEGKYRVLSDALSATFRGAPKTPEPLLFHNSQKGSGKDFRLPLFQTIQRPIPIENSWRIPLSVDRDGRAEQSAAEAERLDRIAEEVEQALADMVLAGEVSVRRGVTFIEIEIRTDVLFPSAVARLSEEATPTIRRLGQILEPFPNPVRVEGHTDSVPIATLRFSSNWELSAARSASVVRLLAEEGVVQERLAVVGFGEYRPIADNGTAVGRQQNRRVTLIVLGEQERNDAGLHGFRGWTQNEMLPSEPTASVSHVASEPTSESKE